MSNYFEKHFNSYEITGLVYRVNDVHSRLTDLEGGNFDESRHFNNLVFVARQLEAMLKIEPRFTVPKGYDKEQFVIDCLANTASQVWPNLYMLTSKDKDSNLATIIIREREFDSAGLIVPSGTATNAIPTLALAQAVVRLLYSSLVQQFLIYLSPGLSQSAGRQDKSLPYEDWAREGLQGFFESVTERHANRRRPPATGGVVKRPPPPLPMQTENVIPKPVLNTYVSKNKPRVMFVGPDNKLLSDADAQRVFNFLFGDKKKLH